MAQQDTTPAAGSGQINIPAAGQPWPGQQALFAGIVSPAAGAPWALLLPTDAPKLPSQAWGEYGVRIDGADSVLDGHANTLAMAASGNKLAQAVCAIAGDCYLPSPLEVLMLFATLRKQVGPGTIWTSRQSSAYSAWSQSFHDGGQYINSKDCEFRAVPVRRLILRSFNASAEVLVAEGGAA